MIRAKSGLEQIDVAILGGGPAGLQAALVLSRTRKKIVVFDDPEPPRNAASHGVHNFIGLDGLLPTEIRKIVWKQIDSYNSTDFRKEKIVNVKRENGAFIITNDSETSVRAKRIILAVGYHDVYPDIPGFIECWADTIIPCTFCDGYENRDRIWGIVVNSKMELEKLPKMAQNWTSKIKVFISPNMEITPSYQNELSKLGIPIYRGIIKKVNHTNSKVESILLNSGEKIETETLLWIPSKRPSPLIQKLVQNMGVELDQQGYVKTDKMQQTNIKGLYAAGDVQNPFSGALEAAYTGGMSAVSIVH
ncbi:MAG TPA: NAD(P)/FAD-dependent oxidoreductase, partial [Nitrososphaeraceae archaeon]|nr:NAD(P)/FAD-dependent oxidoreductase [Nitrososphaeraceae archaeon]